MARIISLVRPTNNLSTTMEVMNVQLYPRRRFKDLYDTEPKETERGRTKMRTVLTAGRKSPSAS